VALFGSLARRRHPETLGRRRGLFGSEGKGRWFNSPRRPRGADDDHADVRPTNYLVLQNAEAVLGVWHAGSRYLPIQKKLAARSGQGTWCGLSDARMSGTAFGTVILHVTPDSASGGLWVCPKGDRHPVVGEGPGGSISW